MADFPFYKMAAVRHLGFLKVANFNLRFGSEADSMQILIFCTLSLKMLIHAPQIEVFGGF